MGGAQGPSLDADQVRLSVTAESNRRDRWHSGSRKLDGPPNSASGLVLVTSARTALGKGMEAEVSIPLAWLEAEDEAGAESSSGVGDILTRVHWSRSKGALRYGVTAGLYWPVGGLGGRAVPTTATFSSGTLDPSVGGFATGPAIFGADWQLSFDARVVISDQDDGSRLGSSYTSVVGLSRRLSGRIDGQLLLTHFSRQPDTGNRMEDTGGDWVYVQPFLSGALVVRPSYAVQLVLGARIPAIQNVRGTQLVESPALSLGIAQTMSF